LKAWRLSALGGKLELRDVAIPVVRPGTVLLHMEAVPILTYLGQYVAGRLPTYRPAEGAFTPGTNGVGSIEATGDDIWSLKPGQRVLLSPHVVSTENVEGPAQVLAGLTAISPDSAPMMDVWRDGTLAEYTLAPASSVTPIPDDLGGLPAQQLAMLGKFVVPLGGLMRSRLTPGETLVVNGATGYFGSAAVLLGLALGAARIAMGGRDQRALEKLKAICGHRTFPVALTGDGAKDIEQFKRATMGGAHVAFDMVGRATDAQATLSALRSLRRGGRLVLMGSMNVPLCISYGEVMLNNWEIIGNFMYPTSAYRRLLDLIRAGALPLDVTKVAAFSLSELPDAIEAAARNRALECTVVLIG
jgi:alcohol dehydrogenase